MNYYLLAVVIGLVSGVISGLFGVGGGIIMVPAMMFFLSLDIKKAIGTSLAVMVLTAATGAWKHSQIGNIDWRVALCMIPTAILGGFAGSWLTQAITSANLKRAFGCLLILAGARLLMFK